MKKKIIIASLFLITGWLAGNAQDAGLTIVAGINQSWWYGKDLSTLSDPATGMYMGKNLPSFEFGQTRLLDDDGNPVDGVDTYVLALGNLQRQTGYTIGFEVNSEISNHFWLKHRFTFETKGFRYSGTRFDTLGRSTESGIDMRLRTYNVDIVPFGVDFEIEGLEAWAGPYVSVNLGAYWVEGSNATGKEVSQAGVYDFHYYDLATDKIESREIGILDYGAAGGIEYKFPFGMSIGGTYKWGFGRMYEARPRHTKTSAFRKQLGVTIGYTIGS